MSLHSQVSDHAHGYQRVRMMCQPVSFVYAISYLRAFSCNESKNRGMRAAARQRNSRLDRSPRAANAFDRSLNKTRRLRLS
jgi:hypothetical protein